MHNAGLQTSTCAVEPRDAQAVRDGTLIAVEKIRSMVRAPALTAIVVLTGALAGCPASDDTGDPDAADKSGLHVTWSTAPVVPGPVGLTASISRLELHVSSVRVIGDAGPGDTRTSKDSVDLKWKDGESPSDILFKEAPAGLYSSVDLGVGGDLEQLEIEGSALIGGSWMDFEIQDQATISASLPLALTLAAGDSATIPIVFDLGPALAAVPFDQLAIEEGRRHLDTGDAAMAAVRAALIAGIHLGPTAR